MINDTVNLDILTLLNFCASSLRQHSSADNLRANSLDFNNPGRIFFHEICTA